MPERYGSYATCIMEDIKVKTSEGPITRPLEVLTDAAYDDEDIRKYLRFRVIKAIFLSILGLP